MHRCTDGHETSDTEESGSGETKCSRDHPAATAGGAPAKSPNAAVKIASLLRITGLNVPQPQE